MTDQKNESVAIHPVVEAPYPKVAWEYYHIFGGSDKFDENNNPVDEAKWRDHSIHVPPQKRFDAAYKKGFLADKSRLKVSAARANLNSSIVTTIDTRVVFAVKELIYPGDKVIDLKQKWIYAFHVNAGKVLAEVFAVSPTKWLFRYEPVFPANASIPLPDQECDGKLELPMIKASETGSNIGFIISPFRLTGQAIDFLLEDTERLKAACVCAVRESGERFLAAVPDPYQWATDAHEKYYIPLLNEWQEYIFDPKLQAQHFIAATLKAWIEAPDKGIVYDSKDPLDIEDELKSRDHLLESGEPYKFLENYRAREEELRIKAEKAGAYLYHCVYSPEHRALEMAALEAKDLSLCLTFQNWAVVCDRACETAQGRLFAVRAYKDPSRLPRQYLFSEEAVPPLNERLGINFPNLRYAWQAGISIVGDLVPSAFEYFKKLKTEEAARVIRKQVMTYMENIGMKFPSSMVNPDRLPNLKRYGKKLYHQLKNAEEAGGLKMVKGVEELYERIQKVAPLPEMDVKKATELDLLVDQGRALPESRLSKLNQLYEDSFLKRNRLKIAFVFESINVVLAISEFSASNLKREWNNDKFVSLLGASADFTSVMAEATFNKIGWEKAGKVAVGKSVAGFAGIIGGICQMTDEQRQMVEGTAQYDYGVATGHGLAAAGAAMTAVGGGLVLAEAIGVGSAAGGPIGAAIGAIGAGLIIGGNLLAAWLKDNQHEQFARFCFLGKQYDTVANKVYELNEAVAQYMPFSSLVGRQPYQRTPVYTEWSTEGGLPTDDILKEARLLIWLLSGFQIALEQENAGNPANGNSSNPEAFIKILPGYLPPSASVEIKLEQIYTHRNEFNPSEKFEATMIFDQMNDEITFLRGNLKPLQRHNQVKRDNFGNVEYLRFAIRPEQVKFDDRTMSFDEYLDYRGIARYPKSSIVKARITMGRVFQPSASKYLRLKTLEENRVSSSNNSNWSA